jgi:hypothetical protein
VKSIGRIAIGLAIVGSLVGGTTLAANAGTGDVVNTKNFGAFSYSSGGQVRARVSSSSITWGKNTIDGSQWVTYKATFRDASTDGVCAHLEFDNRAYDWSQDPYKVYTECNAANVTKSYSIRGRCVTSALIELWADQKKPSASKAYPRPSWMGKAAVC